MLSDCSKCWNTPCTCGYDYRKIQPEQMEKFIADIMQYRSKEEALTILDRASQKIRNNNNFIEK